jgi:L-fuculose-phosphate aldolase
MTTIEGPSPEIVRVLEQLSRVHRILEIEGHGDMSMGHMSYRDPEGRGMWLKRGHLALSEVTESDYLLVDLEGKVLWGEGFRHLEWPLHAEIFKARQDVNFVGHSHAHYATVFGAGEGELAPVNNHGVWFAEHGVPRFAETSHIITTVELGTAVAKQLADAEAILLANHGIAFTGGDIRELLLCGVFLEWSAKFQIDLDASGLKYSLPDHAESIEKHARIYPEPAKENYWKYFNRMLDRAEGRTPERI